MQTIRPRSKDPIILIHLGTSRPYARFGFIDRNTGSLTYAKLNPEEETPIIPRSWVSFMRKHHPFFEQHKEEHKETHAVVAELYKKYKE